ncbi:DNA-binding HORMA family protein [Euphorbia peplus]|nr:DNA-binding HORMA family protein [Euphorbia peplus]
MDPKSNGQIDRTERVAYDELRKKYLKTLFFCLCKSIEALMIEEYTFNSDSQEVPMNINLTGTEKQGGTLESSADEMIDTILHLMRTLNKMLEGGGNPCGSVYTAPNNTNKRPFLLFVLVVLFQLVAQTIPSEPPQPPRRNPENLLILRVYDHNNNMIFSTSVPRVSTLWDFKIFMFRAWCIRHHLEESYCEAYTLRAHRRNPPDIWTDVEKIVCNFYEHIPEVRGPSGLPDDLSMLGNVVIIETANLVSRSYGFEYHGTEFKTMRRFVDMVNRHLFVPYNHLVEDGLELENSTQPTMMIQTYNHEGVLIFRGLYPQIQNEDEFFEYIYRGWMVRHFVDDEFWWVMLRVLKQKAYPPKLWMMDVQIWYFYNGLFYPQPPTDWKLLEKIIIHEDETQYSKRWGREVKSAEVFVALLLYKLGERYTEPFRVSMEDLPDDDDYYGDPDEIRAMLNRG